MKMSIVKNFESIELPVRFEHLTGNWIFQCSYCGNFEAITPEEKNNGKATCFNCMNISILITLDSMLGKIIADTYNEVSTNVESNSVS